MYDFAGWFGPAPFKDSPSVLENGTLEAAALQRPDDHCGLIAGSTSRLGASGPVTVLLAGHPRWRTDAIKNRARQGGDAFLLAELYRERGPAVIGELGGGFAVVIYDRAKREGLVAIDRMGICPLAYAETASGLLFSGDIQTLVRLSGEKDLDPQALFAYLYFHMIPAPLSAYRGIRKLLPGQYLRWRPAGLESGFHWQPDFREDREDEAELSRALRQRLEAAVAEALEDPETSGAFLSGGLDSSTVCGLFKRLAPQQATAFSIGFAAEGYDEMDYARASARHFGIPLHEYYVTPEDVVEAVPKIAAGYDEPFGNASAVPTYYCARLAASHGRRCLLAGDGGDELFAGNERYAKQKLFSFYHKLPLWLRAALIEPLANLSAGLPKAGKLKSYVDQANMAMPERMESYNFLHRTPLAEIFEADFLATINSDWPIAHLREIYARADASLLKRMLALDWKITLADNDLRKVNRMCAVADMEVRYPMLQEPVVELAARIPDRLLMRGLELRSFYRRAFRDFLAPETLAKSKHGFGLPFGLWLRTDPALQALAYDSLNSPYLRGIIRKDYLDRLLSAHSREHASYYGTMIWVLMMLAQWRAHHEE